MRYRALAAQVMETCGQSGVLCILHSFHRAAAELGAPVHLPMPVLREMSEKERSAFEIMGASRHSVDEAREAQALGCTYITAGHVFATDCKKGPRRVGRVFCGRYVKRSISRYTGSAGSAPGI